ncbi:hypothetical protein JCM1841_002336 [Sporobolomyces salmonicolor]
MPSLLDLPPELVLKILLHAVSSDGPLAPLDVLPFSLLHRSLTALAQSLAWRSLTLTSEAHIRRVLVSPVAGTYVTEIRSLRFLPHKEADEGRDGGFGTILGTGQAIEGRPAGLFLEWLSSERKGGLRVLDVASVKPLRVERLEGELLADLTDLTLGTGLVFPTSSLPRSSFAFAFHLTSLTLHNNHWESLPAFFLSALLSQTCANLRHLDLSATYDIANFGPFLSVTSPSPDPGSAPLPVLATLHTLRLPPLESIPHFGFATTALSLTRSLCYLELPLLSAPYDPSLAEFWTALAGLQGSVRAVGLRGYSCWALFETAAKVIETLCPEATTSPTGRVKLKRVRLLGVQAEQVSSGIGSLDLEGVAAGARPRGVAVECGPFDARVGSADEACGEVGEP